MFTASDFKIFDEPTLAGRMHLIKTVIDPKFEAIAAQLIPTLTTQTGRPFYAHVAQHLRRYKNPPVDTWVAFSDDHRRYKALPHFELGLWPDRLFIYLDLLDEGKTALQAQVTPADLQAWLAPLSADYVISHNHAVAQTEPATPNNITKTITKFDQYRHSELVTGRSLMLASPLLQNDADQLACLKQTLVTLSPIYMAIMQALEA
ncbi:DUF1054 domain-containing protein [Lactobacillus sp. CBA3605]|uniref:DUF1054 family protein n=1 Tax=Lactobacillus sp. CBA3605 TaxID=2099788 RepID=UPI000CFB632F|nr:DUF1054 family protein [Lactobacillus sp. CBA3605]AVK60779.1 DUF1054 domain-containing protein [Lactobacillus sp. CBA3605]